MSAGTRINHRRQASAHRGGVAQGVGALVGAGLPAMQTPGCACRNAYQPSPASRLPQKRGGAGCGCACESWLASDADARLCLQERVAAIAGKPAPTEAEWRTVWVHLWELACQRCRRLVVPAGTRNSHRRQSRLPQRRCGAGRRCTCGSWLASDTDARLCLKQRRQAGCYRTGSDLLCSRPRPQAPT